MGRDKIMANKKETIIVRLTPLELEVLYALQTGDDAQVPLFVRVSVCIAIHDVLEPYAQVIAPEEDPVFLRENLCHVVDWALGMNKGMTITVLQRWFDQVTDYLTRRLEQAQAQHHPTMN